MSKKEPIAHFLADDEPVTSELSFEPEETGEMIYLDVPSEEHELVGRMGARWDPEEQQWYVFEGMLAYFLHWARVFLYVPYEEYEQVKALGAHFDDQRKAWYILGDQDMEAFKPWLADASEESSEPEFVIESDKAFVASAHTQCWKCKAKIEVICLYCETGVVEGEPYTEFTVSNITSMDQSLQEQLKAWPNYHKGYSEELDGDAYLNHCSKCKEPQVDFLLHMEPEGPFFTMKKGLRKGWIRLTPLKGKIRLNGDEGFEP